MNLTAQQRLLDLFEIAVSAEKNSIVFYTALKEIVSATGRDKVDTIISEELGHLAILKTQLTQLP